MQTFGVRIAFLSGALGDAQLVGDLCHQFMVDQP